MPKTLGTQVLVDLLDSKFFNSGANTHFKRDCKGYRIDK